MECRHEEPQKRRKRSCARNHEDLGGTIGSCIDAGEKNTLRGARGAPLKDQGVRNRPCSNEESGEKNDLEGGGDGGGLEKETIGSVTESVKARVQTLSRGFEKGRKSQQSWRRWCRF